MIGFEMPMTLDQCGDGFIEYLQKEKQVEQYDLTPAEKLFVEVFDNFAEACYNAARSKGFWDAHGQVLNILHSAIDDDDLHAKLTVAVDKAFLSQKRDLMHSELGEQTEAARKDLSSDKLEGFSGEEEELADLFVRAGDYAGRQSLRIGLAIVLKMRYNSGRAYLHGKKF